MKKKAMLCWKNVSLVILLSIVENNKWSIVMLAKLFLNNPTF